MTPLQAESRKPGAPVQVLLACYQGEAYLPELLASLDAQRDGRESVPFTVLARDDGSTDGTLDLLRAWRDRQPHRVRLLDDPAQTLGECDQLPGFGIGLVQRHLHTGNWLDIGRLDDYEAAQSADWVT